MYSKKNGRMTFKSNRRPNYKRNNNYGNKGRNKGNITQQYNKYLKLAKDSSSSGDRIQAEYYYQFTDHYFRLMQELGITLEEQDTNQESREVPSDSLSKVSKELTDDRNIVIDNNETDESKEIEDDQSIVSVPFISEPIKKKRTKTSK
tara:strand:+ start:10398 stop:10841 length:444 start_codon:yes stop_codon:yes gene_type:complete